MRVYKREHQSSTRLEHHHDAPDSTRASTIALLDPPFLVPHVSRLHLLSFSSVLIQELTELDPTRRIPVQVTCKHPLPSADNAARLPPSHPGQLAGHRQSPRQSYPPPWRYPRPGAKPHPTKCYCIKRNYSPGLHSDTSSSTSHEAAHTPSPPSSPESPQPKRQRTPRHKPSPQHHHIITSQPHIPLSQPTIPPRLRPATSQRITKANLQGKAGFSSNLPITSTKQYILPHNQQATLQSQPSLCSHLPITSTQHYLLPEHHPIPDLLSHTTTEDPPVIPNTTPQPST